MVLEPGVDEEEGTLAAPTADRVTGVAAGNAGAGVQRVGEAISMS
jgi:hypothetical protein